MRVHLVFYVIVSILLGGCAAIDEANHQSAINAASMRQIICVDGVEYIAFSVKDGWAVAPHYKPDGTLYTCTDSVPRIHY